MLGVYKQYHLMRGERKGRRWHEILYEVRQRGRLVLERGKKERKHFCSVSRPASEAQIRVRELVEEGQIAHLCASPEIRWKWRVVKCVYCSFLLSV